MTGGRLNVQPQRDQQPPKQCINADGTIGNDTTGSLLKPNVVTFDFLDFEGYVVGGFGIHFGFFLVPPPLALVLA